jgi:hypothetical protein
MPDEYELQEAHDAALLEIEIDEMLADEERSTVRLPVECIVNGHDFASPIASCARCGSAHPQEEFYGSY